MSQFKQDAFMSGLWDMDDIGLRVRCLDHKGNMGSGKRLVVIIWQRVHVSYNSRGFTYIFMEHVK